MSRVRFRDRLAARNVGRDIWLAKQNDSEVALRVAEVLDSYDQALAITNRRERRKAVRQVCEQAEPLFRGSEITYGIDPATVWLLIQIAIMVWKWWQSKQIVNPPEVVGDDEPFMSEDIGDLDDEGDQDQP